jgi:hypothetical protein
VESRVASFRSAGVCTTPRRDETKPETQKRGREGGSITWQLIARSGPSIWTAQGGGLVDFEALMSMFVSGGNPSFFVWRWFALWRVQVPRSLFVVLVAKRALLFELENVGHEEDTEAGCEGGSGGEGLAGVCLKSGERGCGAGGKYGGEECRAEDVHEGVSVTSVCQRHVGHCA